MEKKRKTVFADDITVNLENPKESWKNLLELRREFDKEIGQKHAKRKSLSFLYSSNKTRMEKGLFEIMKKKPL